MAMKSAATVSGKWARNLGAAGDSMREGIEAVSENPAQKAKAQKEVMRQNYIRSLDNGKWDRGMDRVTLESWKRDMIQKGVSRATGNAAAAQPKVEAFFAEFLPFIEAAQRQLPPRGNFEANKQRMLQMVDKLHGFRRRA